MFVLVNPQVPVPTESRGFNYFQKGISVMAKPKITGRCHICGIDGPLTYEHVPPEAAFNDQRVVTPPLESYINKGPDELPSRGPINQRGAGGYTLCSSCNSLTGTWYVPAYVDIAYQAAILLQRSQGELCLQYPYRIFPLRFIKQVIAMFCSVNRPGFVEKNTELRRFLLDKESKYLDPKIKIFTYLTTSSLGRQSGFSTAFMDGQLRLYSEIGFPPLGFILTYDSFPPDNRLLDISYFATYDYNYFDTFFLKLSVLPINYFIPGDFRTRDEIMQDYQRNVSEFSN
jgi:hypothetical protein